jgi:hypothetical protein
VIGIGFHTDAFNSSYWNFAQCLEWAHRNDLHYIECGAIDGVLSIECEGQGGPMIERSLAWVRNTLTEVASPVGGSF